MNITPISAIKNRDAIKASAIHSADACLGPQSNQYPEGSAAHAYWLSVYYDRVQENSIACAA